MNPSVTNIYKGPDYFINRTEETKTLIGAIQIILKNHKKSFDPLVIHKILEDTYCHTGFTQMVLSRVFSESVDKIDFELYEQGWFSYLFCNSTIP